MVRVSYAFMFALVLDKSFIRNPSVHKSDKNRIYGGFYDPDFVNWRLYYLHLVIVFLLSAAT